MPPSPPPLTLTSCPVSASERIGAHKLGWAERGQGGAGGREGTMHPRRDRLDGDKAGASFGHSLGAPPGHGREDVKRLEMKGCYLILNKGCAGLK